MKSRPLKIDGVTADIRTKLTSHEQVRRFLDALSDDELVTMPTLIDRSKLPRQWSQYTAYLVSKLPGYSLNPSGRRTLWGNKRAVAEALRQSQQRMAEER